MRIDAARHHITAAGVDDFCAGGSIDRGADRDNRLAVDKQVRAAGVIVIYDRSTADQDSHGISEQAICVMVNLACNSRFGSENLAGVYSMIRKSGNRFSEKIMLKQRNEIMIRFNLIGS
jgi:ethanolamine utilization microcompartment shell protein EutL